MALEHGSPQDSSTAPQPPDPSGGPPGSPPSSEQIDRASSYEHLPLPSALRVDAICMRFEEALRGGLQPSVEAQLEEVPTSEQASLLIELLHLERELKTDEPFALTDYVARFPEHATVLSQVFSDTPPAPGREPSPERVQSQEASLIRAQAPHRDPSSSTLPHCPHYELHDEIAHGAAGVVYRATDLRLEREVAVKVVPAGRMLDAGPAPAPEQRGRSQLEEAKVLASLDHPHIVPVYDVGRTEDGDDFVVSKLIQGRDLARRMVDAPFSHAEIATLVAHVADALHHAHTRGCVHRDVKPANILIDSDGSPHVTDFGLALQEAHFGQGSHFAGTPAYMSPEQARREGHRVDGRSDLFSLGVVLYELLCRRRPFPGTTAPEVLEEVIRLEPRPPRQVDDTVPKSLERICLRALAKRASDRYTTGRDMADDLRHFLTERSSTHAPPGETVAAQAAAGRRPLSSALDRVRVVPKGLRAFDAHDADFFLALLPGPRDREGLPQVLRFWKSQIEETAGERTFSVGLLYGPSGCGKSSLVNAGLLPLLNKSEILVVHAEAVPHHLEATLAERLRRQLPELPPEQELPQLLSRLRLGTAVSPHRKVLLVIDQFEQWLFGDGSTPGHILADALRQCDGARVQCLLLVRDDFWMAATRLMREIEVPIVEGWNAQAVDLFDRRHARRVLEAFGRAFGALANKDGQLSDREKRFLEAAVDGLAENDRVVSVRLALFAEILKDKNWVPETLRRLGGTSGVGAAFLEESFSSRSATLAGRVHEKAARSVLAALLPDSGIEIKGFRRSRKALLQVSGYHRALQSFDSLLHLLDPELRLVTRVDVSPSQGSAGKDQPEPFYQLTHDYLVPALRDWLARKQRETFRGRAELHLAERARLWKGKEAKRELPTPWEWLRIQFLTDRARWSDAERRVMRSASRRHVVRGVVLAVLFTTLGWLAFERYGMWQARSLRERLLGASTLETPAIIDDMTPYRRFVDPLLKEAYLSADLNPRNRLNVALALLPSDPTQRQYLCERLLRSLPRDVLVIRTALERYRHTCTVQLWERAQADIDGVTGERLRAAAALARYDHESDKWEKLATGVAHDLTTTPTLEVAVWMRALHPVSAHLLAPLEAILLDVERPDLQRAMASSVLEVYTFDHPEALATLLCRVGASEFRGLFPSARSTVADFEARLSDALETSRHRPDATTGERTNAILALYRLGRSTILFEALGKDTDPAVRSSLIRAIAPSGCELPPLLKQISVEIDSAVREGLALALCEAEPDAVPASTRRNALVPLLELYHTDANPRVRAALERLVSRWGHSDPLDATTGE